MSTREWKPGDVAVADGSFVVVRHSGDPDYWSAANGCWPHGVRQEELDYRPLVVIDPEDADLAETLIKAFAKAGVWQVIPADVENVHAHRREQIQAALRSLVADPKPEEPTGLGAVVEDADGLRWVCVGGHLRENRWRQDYGKAIGAQRPYADIAAVKVLSPGVTP